MCACLYMIWFRLTFLLKNCYSILSNAIIWKELYVRYKKEKVKQYLIVYYCISKEALYNGEM